MTISLTGSDPSDPEVAELLSLVALKVDWSSDGGAVRVLVDGAVGAEVLASEERFCARVDLEAFQPLAEWEPGQLEAMRAEVADGAAEQLGSGLASDVSLLLEGEWGCLSADALAELQDAMGQGAAPAVDPAVLAELTGAMRDAADGIVDPWSVEDVGDDDLGRHLVAKVDAVELADGLADFVDVLQAELDELGALDQLEGMAGLGAGDIAGMDELAGGRWSDAVREGLANAQGEITVDSWVDDGELRRVKVDLVAAAEALSGEEAPEGTAAALTLDFDQDADLPAPGEGAVDLGGFVTLLGVAMAGMGQGF